MSHFNISLILRDTVTRQCPQTTTFEEKGELKQIQTEVPLLTSLTPYCWAKPALKSDNGREALQTSMDTKQHCNRDRPTPRESSNDTTTGDISHPVTVTSAVSL